MSNKTLAGLTMVVGIVLVALGLLADVLGLGSHPGFGWSQVVAIVVGLAALAGGIAWYRSAAGVGSRVADD